MSNKVGIKVRLEKAPVVTALPLPYEARLAVARYIAANPDWAAKARK